MTTLKTILAQQNYLVGDIEGNARKIVEAIYTAQQQYHADLIVFSELSITGYPPEDLLFRPVLYERIAQVLPSIKAAAKEIDVILGYPEKNPQGFYNQAAFISKGEIVKHYFKQILPNYNVFDEVRYFKHGDTSCVVEIKKIPIAIMICEDLWFPQPIKEAKKAGAKLVVSLNASPFDVNKAATREKIIGARARENNMPILYVNCVGGQDELVFDGGSMAFNAHGEISVQADFFKEEFLPVEIKANGLVEVVPGKTPKAMRTEERIYNSLVLGVRDYIEKNHFPRAILGLSGGIDSAITLAIVVDAIGKDRVEAVMMPSRYTSEMSLQDAKTQAEAMGVKYSVISIEPMFQAYLESLKEEFANYSPDVTEENLQARCRGTLLMAISNKKKAIVLATGNKSESAVGYATLYGDMVGGFCALKDVFKTMVYRLAEYRNQLSPVIPKRVIERAPSAELAENQIDQNSLPPYPILDEILERYIERDQGIYQIVEAGFDEETVRKVAIMVNLNEYKRRQAAPGVKITERAFGKDRRYPITSGYIKNLRK
jgi:NAD+ synthase (glutamine-hydrolysing)